jgi:hypothetical protein
MHARAAGTPMPCCSPRMRYQAAPPPAAAAVGPSTAVPVLQLPWLLLPFSSMLPQQPQLRVRGWASSTVDRWRPDELPVGHVRLGAAGAC